MKAHAACLPRLSIDPKNAISCEKLDITSKPLDILDPRHFSTFITRLELSVPAGMQIQVGRLPQDRKHTFAENRGLPR